MDDTSHLFQSLGRIEGKLDGLATRVDDFGHALKAHIGDDAKLSDNLSAVMLEQASTAGVEARRHKGMIALGTLVATAVGAIGGVLGRWPFGAH